jgi:hypothetical protein
MTLKTTDCGTGHDLDIVETLDTIDQITRHRRGKIISARFDLRFLRPFRADLSIKKSLSFFPALIAATNQRGLAPRPAQVSPIWPRYLGAIFLPFNALPCRLPRAILPPPRGAELPNLSNCF